MSWFFVAPDALGEGTVRLDRDDSHHLLKVLRARPGAEFTAVCAGQAYRARLATTAGGRALGDVVAVNALAVEPPVAVTVFQGLAKGDKMEVVIQKCTELGATAFVPVAAARSVVHLSSDRAADRVQRWQRVAREAAQQSRRGQVPTVRPVLPWAAAVQAATDFDLALVLWEEAAGAGPGGGLKQALAEWASSGGDPAATRRAAAVVRPAPGSGVRTIPGSVALYIGPEGGLAADEVAAARAAGARSIGFGPRILRTETAAPAVLAALLYAVGDLG